MSETQKSSGRRPPPSTPRWVKVFVIIFIVLVVLVVILHLMGLGFGSHRISETGNTWVVDFVRYTRLLGAANPLCNALHSYTLCRGHET